MSTSQASGGGKKYAGPILYTAFAIALLGSDTALASGPSDPSGKHLCFSNRSSAHYKITTQGDTRYLSVRAHISGTARYMEAILKDGTGPESKVMAETLIGLPKDYSKPATAFIAHGAVFSYFVTDDGRPCLYPPTVGDPEHEHRDDPEFLDTIVSNLKVETRELLPVLKPLPEADLSPGVWEILRRGGYLLYP
ncbi:MAG: hypothetical protein QF798_02330 [Candidatus Woesearchaeota archaeon]|jgi:hypothetical protein|nr:hypothetical protein [Candidatus Woesearchaeota archaeon]|tara:strand:- start:11663 stop:12244 length:582 start_codon:yes stop_codon:yes gene_type:complete